MDEMVSLGNDAVCSRWQNDATCSCSAVIVPRCKSSRISLPARVVGGTKYTSKKKITDYSDRRHIPEII